MVVQLAQMWGNTEKEENAAFYNREASMATSIVMELFILFTQIHMKWCVYLVYNRERT